VSFLFTLPAASYITPHGHHTHPYFHFVLFLSPL
jgi:hypothetical protein